jgi:hypothetical protein
MLAVMTVVVKGMLRSGTDLAQFCSLLGEGRGITNRNSVLPLKRNWMETALGLNIPLQNPRNILRFKSTQSSRKNTTRKYTQLLGMCT